MTNSLGCFRVVSWGDPARSGPGDRPTRIRIAVGAERRVMTHPAPPHTTPPSRTTRTSRRRTRTLVGAVLMGAALVLAACSSSGSATSTTMPMSTPTTASGSGSSGATTDAITIKNFAFAPASLTVAPGATITVTNKDSVAHTITSTKAGFNTGDIAPGQSKTFTAPKTPGSYPYICSIHQYMTGTLKVSG
jgi:plastocyanin